MRGFLAVFHSGLPNNNHAVTPAMIRSPKYLHIPPCDLGFHSNSLWTFLSSRIRIWRVKAVGADDSLFPVILLFPSLPLTPAMGPHPGRTGQGL